MKGILLSLAILLILPSVVSADVWDGFPVILWTFQHQPICNDGRNSCPNIERTADAMQDLGATAIYQDLTDDGDYSNLMGFLESTEGSGIKVWALMNPWCDMEPYPLDCAAWAGELANLRLQYPHLEAFTLDDLAPDSRDFVTPEWVTDILDAKNAISTGLKMIPTLYYDARDEMKYFREGNSYDGIFEDGTSMWYWASYGSSNREPNLELLQGYIDEANQEVHPIPFFTGIYTLKNGRLQDTFDVNQMFHDQDVLRSMLEIAVADSDGLGLFNMPLFVYDVPFLLQSTIFQQQANDDPAYDYMLTSKDSEGVRKGTFTSWYQAIKTSVPVPVSGNVRVQFDIRDTRSENTDVNYIFKQLVINDNVVWEADIHTDGSDRLSIDEQVFVTGPQADIVVRLFTKRANWIGVSAYVDDPVVYVDGSPVAATWVFDSNLSKMDEYVETYNTIRSVLKGSSQCGNSLCDSGECSSCPQDCFIAECDDDGSCSSHNYKDGTEDCGNSQDCPCTGRQLCCSGSCVDPACSSPQDCGSNPCREYTCNNPGTCSASCSFTEITQCIDNDGCCPAGCTEQDDSDCGSGLVGWWTMDSQDTTGGQAFDKSGLGNHGTIYSATPVTGRVGEALYFDGLDDYIDCGSDTSLDTNEMTVLAWIKPLSVGEGGPNAAAAAKAEDSPADWSWQIRYNAPGGGDYLGFQATNLTGGITWTSVGQSLAPGTWYHITARYNGFHVSMYLDGQETGSEPLSDIKSSASSFLIGNDGWDNIFNGTIDEVMIWNRSLSAHEIFELYDSAFHSADTSPKDGCVEEHELIPFIDLWKYDSTANPMREMMEAVTKYYNPGDWCS